MTMQVGIETLRKHLEHVSFTWDKLLFIHLPWCDDPKTQISLLRAMTSTQRKTWPIRYSCSSRIGR